MVTDCCLFPQVPVLHTIDGGTALGKAALAVSDVVTSSEASLLALMSNSTQAAWC